MLQMKALIVILLQIVASIEGIHGRGAPDAAAFVQFAKKNVSPLRNTYILTNKYVASLIMRRGACTSVFLACVMGYYRYVARHGCSPQDRFESVSGRSAHWRSSELIAYDISFDNIYGSILTIERSLLLAADFFYY